MKEDLKYSLLLVYNRYMIKVCIICNKEFETELNSRIYCSDICSKQAIKHKKLEYYYRNRDKEIKRNKEWKSKNKEIVESYQKEYYENNKDRLKEKGREYCYINRDKRIEYMKNWHDVNKLNQIKYRNENKDKKIKYYLDNIEVIKEKRNTYRKNNIDKITEQNRKYYYKNKEKIIEKTRLWKLNNVEHNKKWRRNYSKIRRTVDLQFRFKENIKRAFLRNFKEYTKSKSTFEYIEYTFEEFKIHIESLFQEGMTWDNWTYDGWHLDHKIPLSSFNFFNEDGTENIEEIRKAWSLDNLQPLWAKDNLSKGNKIVIIK